MRRFIAYVVMMLTLLGILVFNTQSVLEGTTDAMEFGKATQLTYALTERNLDDYTLENYPRVHSSGVQTLDAIDVEGKIMKRLDLAGVRNADVEIVKGTGGEGWRVNVSFSPLSESEKNNVKTLLAYEGSLAIGTVGDDKIIYQDQNTGFFDDDDIAKVVYSSSNPYPAINIKTSTMMDDLITAAKDAATAHKGDTDTSAKKSARRFNAEGEENKEEADPNETRLILWQNKTASDTYDAAYGKNGTKLNEIAKSKIFAELDTSNYSAENKVITVTTDSEGNAFTASSAKAFVAALNAENYGFDVELLYENAVAAGFGTNAYRVAEYVTIGSLLLVSVLLIVFYGLSGVTASVNMMVSYLVSLLMFNLLGFEFSIAGLAGLAVSAVISVIISSVYFEKVRQEMTAGRTPEKANREGYRKGFFAALDVFAVSFLAALFAFLMSTGSNRTFFGAIMVGSLFTFIITNFMDKWLTYWLVKGVEKNDRPYFAFRGIKAPKEKKVITADRKKNLTKVLVSCAAVGVALAIAIPVTSAVSSQEYGFFKGSDSYSESYKLSITFRDDQQSYTPLNSKENYVDYLTLIGTDKTNDTMGFVMSRKNEKTAGEHAFTYDPSTVTVNVVEKTDEDDNIYYLHYFNANVDTDLSLVDSQTGSSIVDAIRNTMLGAGTITLKDNSNVNPTRDSHYVADSLTVTCYRATPADKVHDTNNFLLIVLLISLFAAVYAFVRYGLNLALAMALTGTLQAGTGIALLSLTRLSYNPYVAFVIFGLVLITDLILLPLLSDNKAIIKEKGLKEECTEEQHAEIENGTANRSFATILLAFLTSIIFFAAMAIVSSQLFTGLVLSVLLSVTGILLALIFGLTVYHFFVCNIRFTRFKNAFYNRRKESQEKREANKSQVNYVDDGAHETIIPGMNDFRK